MSETVNHPAHYGGDTIYETIKVLKAWLTPEQMVGFCVGNAIKYLSRAGHKTADPLEDLRKARWYLDYVTAYLLEQRPATNGSGGTSLETPRPAGVTEEQLKVVQTPFGYAAVFDAKPASKEHIFGTMHEAVLYAGHRQQTTDRPFRAVSCGDQWTVEEVTEANK